MKKLDFSKIKENFSKLFKGNKKVMLTGAAFVVIALILVISIYFPKSNKSQTKTNSGSTNFGTSFSSYASSVEEKLKGMLLQVDGVNKASVFVMVDSSPKVNYLVQTEEVTTPGANGVTSSTKKETVVFEKNGSSQSPIVTSTVMPKITGVLIVTNSISASVKYNIIRAVSVVLNVNESCINILQES